MKKRICLLFVFVFLVILSGCSPADLIPPDPREDMSNDPITQEWKIIEYTVNGETVVLEDDPAIVNVMMASKQPAFSCTDGVNCTFSVNGKSKDGTVSKDGDEYTITFPDPKSSSLKGTIDENNQLTLEIVGKTAVMVFEAKEETEEE